MFTTSSHGFNDPGDHGDDKPKPYSTKLPAMSHEAEDWRAWRRYLMQRGLEPHVARANAWYPSRQAGDDYLRCVIPATSRDRKNRFWQARLIDGKAPEGAKRYQSPAAKRGDALIVVHPEYDPFGPEPRARGTVLVEGPFDALAAAELGFVGVALMGNSPSEEILDHAKYWLEETPPAILVTDQDAVVAGADVGWKLLVHHGLKSLSVLSPYPYKDLAEMPLAERRRLLCW